jgi:hypothetical protein
MSPPARQSVARISEETGIHICTLYRAQPVVVLDPRVHSLSRKGSDEPRHKAGCAVTLRGSVLGLDPSGLAPSGQASG